MASTEEGATTLRPATVDDSDAIQRIVYEAISWNPDESVPPLEQIVDHPDIARYHRDWGRPGDEGVLVVVDGVTVGGAYYRLFTEDDHGHGYIDDRTPEIAIAVWGTPRGKGLGSALLDELHAMARESGVERLSLSVNEDNPAAALYLRRGYVVHSADSASFRMVKTM